MKDKNESEKLNDPLLIGNWSVKGSLGCNG